MQKINGKYTEAAVYAKTMEDYAAAQIKMICDLEAAAGSRMAIMPDVHPGKIGPIGLTMTITDRILPGFIGVDIGCGISCMKLRRTQIEFQKLDKVIREHIPSGSEVRKEAHNMSDEFDFSVLLCRRHINESHAKRSLGTLGGGNHFIELDKDEKGGIYAVVHSGSRHLGKEVTEYYMKKGQEELKKKGIFMPYELTYLEGQLKEEYLHDMKEVQNYAKLNRSIILRELAKGMKWNVEGFTDCCHNYIDENNVLRKGSAAAYEGEEVIIPINMKDGVIIGTGKGNPDWNFSAPHGAGRIASRQEVKKHHTVSEYKKAMKGIYSATISEGTLAEAPFAYRGIEEIAGAIRDTVEIREIIRPIYNFKGEKR